jgi:hypothetical protein
VCGAAIGLLALLASGAPSRAAAQQPTDVRPHRSLSLDDLSRAAGTIVVGRVAEVRVGTHPRYRRLPVTFITLTIQETWKGARSRTLTFLQFGQVSAAGTVRPPGASPVAALACGDMPTYAPGEEVLLFLRRPSHLGLTSPVGERAGKLAIRRDAATGRAGIALASTRLSNLGAVPGSVRGWIALESLRARVVRAARSEAGR